MSAWHPNLPESYRNQIVTGDARELATRIPDGSIRLIVTDPPFGLGFNYQGEYDDDSEEYLALMKWLIQECNRVIEPEGYIFIFTAQSWARQVWNLIPNARMFSACRSFVQLNRPIKPYRFGAAYAYDPVFFWSNSPKGKPEMGKDYFVAETSITQNRGINEAGWHPCPRPLSTIQYLIANHSKEDDVVLDFFMGSGTTAVAAKTLHRRYVGFEQSEIYAARARERVANTQPPLFIAEPQQMRLEISPAT